MLKRDDWMPGSRLLSRYIKFNAKDISDGTRQNSQNYLRRQREDDKDKRSPQREDGFQIFLCCTGDEVAQLLKALRYKPEGRGFDS
jgi:hypothetical protein